MVSSEWSVLVMCFGLVMGHTTSNDLDSMRYGPTDEKIMSDSYTMANINITYIDENGAIYTEITETGKFGEGFVGSAHGVAVHIRAKPEFGENDHSGCSLPLLSVAAPDKPFPSEPWIAVMRRGSCNFELKVQNAWKANASAVLIYNDRDTTLLEKMKLNTDTGRNISAVFTYKWKGEEIARYIDNNTRVMIGIIKGRTYTHFNNNINKTSVLFVSISFIVLMVISLAWLVFYYIQRFRYIHAKDRLSKRLCYAAKKALSKIPVKSIKSDDREVQGDGECCAICIEPYKVSDTLRSLPCSHEFHKSCIDPWLLEHRTCPMCKMDILKYYGFIYTGSQESILQIDMEESHSPTRPRRVITLHLGRELSFDSGSVGSGRSSRASSPDHLVSRCDATPMPHRNRSRPNTPGSSSGDLARQETSSIQSNED